MKQISRGAKITNRRKTVLERLTNQLKSGVKNQRVDTVDEVVPLSDKDRKRIEKEIGILKERL